MTEIIEELSKEQFLQKFPETKKFVDEIENKVMCFAKHVEQFKIEGQEIISNIVIDFRTKTLGITWNGNILYRN